ncbi:MAG: tRNA (N(6)-L-threonylcarbamoyladenosine(37)-C(2))-methylthiotransferase MtaB [Rhodospirillales bacterium]
MNAPKGAPNSAPQTVTLGCRLNTFESEVMRRHAADAGIEGAVIVNTCAVTKEAERQSRQTVRRLRREHPDARIVVTGCAAQLDPGSWAGAGADAVLGNAEKTDAAVWAKLAKAGGAAAAPMVSDIQAVARAPSAQAPQALLLDGFEGRTRAFVEIQQGCDHRCTFCIIPFARGPNRAVAPETVIARIRALVEGGCLETVLTGVDISSYGMESGEGPMLGRLVRRILDEVPELPRLRLGSIDPAVMDEDLFTALAENDRLMPHLHLSVQALDDMVLKRMKRRHSREGALRFAARARDARPDIVFGADLIAGFPTETETMFENTLAGVDEAGLTYLHVFPYSERPGTPAARMPVSPKDVRRARAARLRARGQARLDDALRAEIGRELSVLEEDAGRGFSRHYAPVQLVRPGAPGQLVSARAVAVESGRLLAEAA